MISKYMITSAIESSINLLYIVKAFESTFFRFHHILEITKLNQKINLVRIHDFDAIEQFRRCVIEATYSRIVNTAWLGGIMQICHHSKPNNRSLTYFRATRCYNSRCGSNYKLSSINVHFQKPPSLNGFDKKGQTHFAPVISL